MTTGTAHLISERALQDVVLQVAKINKWLVYHTHDSRFSESGWPDLVLLRPPRALFVELKAENGKVTAAQAHWLEQLEACGLTVAVWRPSHLDDIIATLTDTAP